jgi:hypothetical protein
MTINAHLCENLLEADFTKSYDWYVVDNKVEWHCMHSLQYSLIVIQCRKKWALKIK